MILETKNLRLSEYKMGDLKDYYALTSCKEVWIYSTFVPFDNLVTAENQLMDVIEKYKENGYGFMALRSKATNHYIGEAGILSYNKSTNRCEVGYNLLPEFWRKGYATEITKELVRYAFEQLHVERVEGRAIQENIGSCKVLQKSGMMLEGVLRNYNKYENGYRNLSWYGIIYSDYFKD